MLVCVEDSRLDDVEVLHCLIGDGLEKEELELKVQLATAAEE